MLVGCGEERPSLGGVVKPIWLLITTCRLPPVEYPAWPGHRRMDDVGHRKCGHQNYSSKCKALDAGFVEEGGPH